MQFVSFKGSITHGASLLAQLTPELSKEHSFRWRYGSTKKVAQPKDKCKIYTGLGVARAGE